MGHRVGLSRGRPSRGILCGELLGHLSEALELFLGLLVLLLLHKKVADISNCVNVIGPALGGLLGELHGLVKVLLPGRHSRATQQALCHTLVSV